MKQNITAEIVSIGTEILLGELTDTNSVYIARTFRDLGINIYCMTSVGDNRQRIAEAVDTALQRAQVVITCGGLGPTVDDVTRQAVADATDRGLTFHQTLLDQIAARFASFKVPMTENNRQQAYLPDDAIVIENPVGTAPSFVVEVGERSVICLPGVPRELKYLMTERIIPYLHERYQLGTIKARLLKVAGVGESSLDDMLGRELLEQSNPTVGLAAHHGEIDIRVTAKADTPEAVDTLIAQTEAKVRERVGKYIYGVDDETLHDVLVNYLTSTGQKLALVQAGIEPVATRIINEAQNGKHVLAADEIFDHPDAARERYTVDASMSLREAAAQIAAQVNADACADATIVILSDPDVEENADEAEVSVVHVYTPQKARERVYGFGGKSEIARQWVARWSLSSVWHMLRDQADAD